MKKYMKNNMKNNEDIYLFENGNTLSDPKENWMNLMSVLSMFPKIFSKTWKKQIISFKTT